MVMNPRQAVRNARMGCMGATEPCPLIAPARARSGCVGSLHWRPHRAGSVRLSSESEKPRGTRPSATPLKAALSLSSYYCNFFVSCHMRCGVSGLVCRPGTQHQYTGGRDSLACGSHAGVTSHARLAPCASLANAVRASHNTFASLAKALCKPSTTKTLLRVGASLALGALL